MKDKATNIIATVYRILTLSVTILAILKYNWLIVGLNLAIFASTFLPLLVEKKFNIKLNNDFKIFYFLFLFLAIYLGGTWDYYYVFSWWDILLHSLFGFFASFYGFILLYFITTKYDSKYKPIILALFAFCFALAIGALWELLEFLLDALFKTNLLKTGIPDTMGDLFVKSLGALVASTLGYLYLKGKNIPLLNNQINSLKKINSKRIK